MARAKSKATIMVAGGTGGMARVEDRRFETGDWPIAFEVPVEQADTWFRYFYAESERRGWASSSFGQLEARENSGSITVNTGGAEQRQLAVVWDWKREGPIKVRARSAGVPEEPLAEAAKFFEHVNKRCRSAATERVYRRAQLHYEGLPWRGEVWFDDTLRLGPPAAQDEVALIGPRVVLVDSLVECVGLRDANDVFRRNLQELSVFLTVVIGTPVHLPEQGRAWTYRDGAADCAVRYVGYFEVDNPLEMPARGATRDMPLKSVNRPDFSLRGIDGTTNELTLATDVPNLWATFCALAPDHRRDFLQAATKWHEALSQNGPGRSTLSFALMVVACEALKPSGQQFYEHNIYHVVEALLDKASAERLRRQLFHQQLHPETHPQSIRSAHLHRGEFRASEYLLVPMMSSYYQDPTFDQARRELARITQAAIIEWLRRGGVFTMPSLQRRKSWRRQVRENALLLLPALTVVGLVLGWFLRSVLYG
jgi:hypothetical protein